MKPPSNRSLLLLIAVSTLAACGPDAPETTPPDGGTTTTDTGAPGLDPEHCIFEKPPASAPGEPSAVGPVRAGFASRVLPMPIGAPLGGYGDRLTKLGQSEPADARPHRFTKSFVPSVGMHDAPKADALAIEAGGERVVLVRIDAPLLNEDALYKVEKAIAADGSMRGRVLLSASHSHAAWAGWQASLVLMPGIDRPHPELADRMIGAMAGAAKDALAALEPAKIGVAVETAFDPADTVSSDRRPENNDVLGPDGNAAGKHKDPIVWAMRVDRQDGSTLAAIVDLPVHGTVGESQNPLVSTDAPGAIARAISAEIGAPVLHFQGAAGDVTPVWSAGRAACPGSTRCFDMPGLETLGARAAAMVTPLIQNIDTTDSAALEVVTRAVPVRRSAEVKRPDGSVLVYSAADESLTPDGVLFNEAGRVASPIDEFNTPFGAGLCGDQTKGSLSAIPGTFGVGPYSSCIELEGGQGIVFGLFDVEGDQPLPLCDTLRVTVTAVRLSGLPEGPYLLVTAPGEPTAPFAAYLRSRSPAGPDKTLLIGYGNDYAGYLLTAEDWLSGGYECSTNIWGPLEGEIIIDGALSVASAAWSPEKEDPEEGSSRFVDWPFPPSEPIATLLTTDHGTVAPALPSIFWPDTAEPVASFPTSAPRATGAIRFAWYGGDPAIDLPEVTVLREVAQGVLEPLAGASGRPASSYEGAVVVTYTPDPLTDAAPSHHVYAAVWQPVPPDPFRSSEMLSPYSLPAGKYRLRAKGRALAQSGEVEYEVTSEALDITEAPLSPSSTAAKGAAGLSITALLPKAPGLRALREGPSDEGVPLPGPWKVTVTFAADPPKETTVTPDNAGHGELPLSAAELSGATSIDVRDPFGNGGSLSL